MKPTANTTPWDDSDFKGTPAMADQQIFSRFNRFPTASMSVRAVDARKPTTRKEPS